VETKLVPVGTLGKPHGVRGEVKFSSFLPDPEDWTPYRKAFLKEEGKEELTPISITGGRGKGKTLIVTVEGWTSPEQVSRFVPGTVYVDRDTLPALPEGSFYWFDLEGMEVVTESDEPVGVIEEIIPTGSNDVCLVRNHMGEERMVPVLKETIRKVDVKHKRMVVRLMEETE
jgi:16S rRNA processing protein RimM